MVSHTQNERLPFYGIVFLIAVFVKQFYILPSGSFQIGDLLFGLAFLLAVSTVGLNQVVYENKKLVYFLLGVCAVNSIYGLLYSSSGFFRTAAYYVFNFFVVLVFDDIKDNARFLCFLEGILKLCLLFQLGILLTGSGRWMEGVRYQGTFNDPNQYGFFVISTFLMLALLMKVSEKKKLTLFWYIITFFLIVPCASTSMVFALFVYIIFHVLFSDDVSPASKMMRIVLVLIVFIIMLMIINGVIRLRPSIEDSIIYHRVLGKLQGMRDGSNTFTDDRNLNIILEHPLYILWGGGESLYSRFGHGGEIHSTVFAILWCNGIIPFGYLVSWIKEKVKSIHKSVWCAYLALLMESFTLVNHRQPMFWMLITFAGAIAMKKNNERVQEETI